MLRRELVRLVSGSILFSATASVWPKPKKSSNEPTQWETEAMITNWPGRECVVIQGLYNGSNHLFGFVQSFEKDSGVYEVSNNEGKSLKVIVGDLDYMISMVQISTLEQIAIRRWKSI